jgi:hypothetical protein
VLLLDAQDADVVGAELLGQAIIPVSEIVDGQLFDRSALV